MFRKDKEPLHFRKEINLYQVPCTAVQVVIATVIIRRRVDGHAVVLIVALPAVVQTVIQIHPIQVNHLRHPMTETVSKEHAEVVCAVLDLTNLPTLIARIIHKAEHRFQDHAPDLPEDRKVPDITCFTRITDEETREPNKTSTEMQISQPNVSLHLLL